MFLIVVDGLLGDLNFGIQTLLVACVWVAISKGKVAADEMDTDAMAAEEDVARWQNVDRVLIRDFPLGCTRNPPGSECQPLQPHASPWGV